ncbi:hypothetical protein [Campylobacter novaezeelandiae]|uniref:hypothetical protein n=1 Tax=Campylobacter novaezeelandiae TaxID=2267891 RepID=UPI001908CFC5|nr:hypothetical protein [Campylobacter novaezeelandiae]MBK1963594.1 hypothetical protein [Campylobacter novaezeelandiae]MBK1993580.1 hypothetical protein [Campylobacter novaezeelandiae]
MTKNEEKKIRIKYIRNLEKFFNEASLSLKKENFDLEKFREKVLKNAKILKKDPFVFINSSYIKNLENFANTCLNFSMKQNDLLKQVHFIEKLKKNQNYKKDKYKNYLKEYM